MLRQQERKQLAEEQARASTLTSEKEELEEKLAAMSRKSSGTITYNFLDQNAQPGVALRCFKLYPLPWMRFLFHASQLFSFKFSCDDYFSNNEGAVEDANKGHQF